MRGLPQKTLLAAAILTAAALLAGCGEIVEESDGRVAPELIPTTLPDTPALPKLAKRVEAGVFSIRPPEGFSARRGGHGAELYCELPSGNERYPPTLTVVRRELDIQSSSEEEISLGDPIDVETLARIISRETAERTMRYRLLRSEIVETDGGKALFLMADFERNYAALRHIRYAFVRGGEAYIVTATARAGEWSRLGPAFGAAAKSFRFVEEP